MKSKVIFLPFNDSFPKFYVMVTTDYKKYRKMSPLSQVAICLGKK